MSESVLEMLRRRVDDWYREVAARPPQPGEECTFTVNAFVREDGSGPVFSIEVTRAKWRNSP